MIKPMNIFRLAGWATLSITAIGCWFRQDLALYFVEHWGSFQTESIADLTFSIDDYFSSESLLDQKVDEWYEHLSPQQQVAQLIMPAWDTQTDFATMQQWITDDIIAGFMLLRSDASPTDLAALESSNPSKIPLLISADAEPSLMKYRFPKSNLMVKTSDLSSDKKIVENANTIAALLQKHQINLNFAPVYDVGQNQSVIGDRAFGESPQIAAKRANTFAETMKSQSIIPTAKHFPGHGKVEGDTHHDLLVIRDELSELESFESAIKKQIPMIMVGHLAVETNQYDTRGLPATVSSQIMSELLREKLGFKGVIITDAMNMGGVNFIQNRDLKSLQAGADIILMPENPTTLQEQIRAAIGQDPTFAKEVEKKVKRVLRLKLSWRLSRMK